MESGSRNQTVKLRPFGDTDLGRSEINRGGTFFDSSGEITAISPCYVMGLRQTIRSRSRFW